MPLTRLLRFMIALAMLFAPISMMGTHAAMAMPAAASEATSGHVGAKAPGGHCADMAMPGDESPPDQAPAKNVDCMIACSCMPPAIGEIAEQLPFAAMMQRPARSVLPHGLNPQAEPRPPRLS